jgi:hypothetical protein
MKSWSTKTLLTLTYIFSVVSIFAQNIPPINGVNQLSIKASNLVIVSIVTDKIVYSPGETVQSKVTVRNIGVMPAKGTLEDPANGYMVDVILSLDDVAPIAFATLPAPYVYQEDMLVIGGRHSNTNTLMPGAEQTFALNFPLPNIMAKPCQFGYVALGAVVDPGQRVFETNELDNTRFTRFKLNCNQMPPTTAPRPDLVISFMSLDIPVGGPGLTFSPLRVEVKNIGSAPAIGTDSDPVNGYMVDVITSMNPSAPVVFAPLAAANQFPEDKLVIGGRISNTKTLAPGASYVYFLTGLKLPLVDLHNYCNKTFFLGSVADPGLKVAESDENNNTRFIEFRVDCKGYTGGN